MSTQHQLQAGYALTITPAVGAPVNVYSVQDSSIAAMLYSARTFGPYLYDATFVINGQGATVVTTLAAAANLGGLLVVNADAPVSAVQASAAVNPTGDDNGLTFTAREYGTGGNSITITYADPGGNDAALSVNVAGKSIVVSLATDENGAITSTAAQVKAAIEAHQPANALVSVAIDTSDSGTEDDGSGVVTAMASAALADGAGTAIGIAQPGAICIDTTGGALYRNSGTLLAPTWTPEIQTGYGTVSGTVNALASLHLYGAGVPVDYTDGDPPATGEGTAPKGAIYSDTTNGLVYRNSGTQAQPAWTALASVP